mmetsp:Transcript_2389/g.3447  ORF Transcript_2389/g.3447 Transcript_2389/m.3447 type:complete len:315 (-) Transcript_2389:37-981(-)
MEESTAYYRFIILHGFALIGIISISKFVLGLISVFYRFFLRPSKNLRKYGEWAIVTGATDGIGKALSFELARKGLNILLVSRTESKLIEVQSELKKAYPKASVEFLQIDFSNFDQISQIKMNDAIKAKDVGILVNNVGISYPHPKFFDELTDAEMQSLIALNVESTVIMTRLALPGMCSRKRGCIVNMASAAAAGPTALLSGYSGAKGFILKLSESLNVEYAPKNIHIQCQIPLLVATKLSKVRKPSWDKPSPKLYAKSAVKFIGYERTCSPYWSHALQLYIMDVLPFFLVNKITYGMHLSLRKRALAKAAKNS